MVAKTNDTQKPVIHLDDRKIPLDKSETSFFGVTTDELKTIIFIQLKSTRSKSRKQRTLFGMVLRAMGIRCHESKKEQLYKIYIDMLRELRDNGKIVLKAGKDSTYVEIAK